MPFKMTNWNDEGPDEMPTFTVVKKTTGKRAQKREAVLAFLAELDGDAKTNRQIAKACGVSHTLVNAIRNEQNGKFSSKTAAGVESFHVKVETKWKVLGWRWKVWSNFPLKLSIFRTLIRKRYLKVRRLSS